MMQPLALQNGNEGRLNALLAKLGLPPDNSAVQSLDSTGTWAQKLGLQDPGAFAARANSGNLTRDDIQKIGQISSVAPQIDANGRVTNAIAFWSDAVTRAEHGESGNGGIFGIKELSTGIPFVDNTASMLLGNTTGGQTGYNAATGGDVKQGVTTDLAGLAAGAGLSQALPSLGLSTVAPTAGPAATGSTLANLAQRIQLADAGTTMTDVSPGVLSSGSGASTADMMANLEAEQAAQGAAMQAADPAVGSSTAGTGLWSTNTFAPSFTLSPTLATVGTTAAAKALTSGQDPNADPNTNINTGPASTSTGQTSDQNSPGIQHDGVTPVPSPIPSSSGPGTSNALSRILDGTASTADYLSLGGDALGTGLGIYTSNEQANKLKEIADRYYAMGEPSRARYEATFAPGFDINSLPWLNGAIDTSTDALLRRASTGGNPVGNPGAMAEILKYVTGNVALPALQNYRTQNANTGGYSSFNTAAPTAATGAVGADSNVYNAIGYGIGALTTPRMTLTDLARSLNMGGLT